ncbi:hypothetical protein, partial [Nocardioides aquaticus]
EQAEAPPEAPPGSDGRQGAGQQEQAARQGELRERNDRGQERRQRAEDRDDQTGVGDRQGQGRGQPDPGEAGTPAYSW